MAFPGLTKLQNGNLFAVFRIGEKHVSDYGEIGLVISKDNGKTWSSPKIITDSFGDSRDPSIQEVSKNIILITYRIRNIFTKQNISRIAEIFWPKIYD